MDQQIIANKVDKKIRSLVGDLIVQLQTSQAMIEQLQEELDKLKSKEE